VRCMRTDDRVELTLKGDDTDQVLKVCGGAALKLSEVQPDGQITWFKVTEYKEQGGIGKMRAVHALVPDTAAQNETHAQA